jgi:hypothetical protein
MTAGLFHKFPTCHPEPHEYQLPQLKDPHPQNRVPSATLSKQAWQTKQK